MNPSMKATYMKLKHAAIAWSQRYAGNVAT